MQQITATALQQRLNDASNPVPLLLDVREPWEFRYCHVEGSVNIPMERIPGELDRLDRQQEMVVICHHGVRSAQVAHFLESAGFQQILNLSGGVAAWAKEVDPKMPTY